MSRNCTAAPVTPLPRFSQDYSSAILILARQSTSAAAFIIMAALRSRCGQYIFVLWFLLSSIYLLFFLAYSQPSQIGCLLYFHTWCGLSANLECRSEMCCKRVAENTGSKKVAKNRYLGTVAQLCRAITSQLRHISTIGKKLVKQQYLFHVSSEYGELRPTSG